MKYPNEIPIPIHLGPFFMPIDVPFNPNSHEIRMTSPWKMYFCLVNPIKSHVEGRIPLEIPMVSALLSAMTNWNRLIGGTYHFYKALFLRPKFQGRSPENMAKHMVLTQLH